MGLKPIGIRQTAKHGYFIMMFAFIVIFIHHIPPSAFRPQLSAQKHKYTKKTLHFL